MLRKSAHVMGMKRYEQVLTQSLVYHQVPGIFLAGCILTLMAVGFVKNSPQTDRFWLN